MSGDALGSDDRRVIVPLDCGFMIKQMAPKYDSESVGSYARKEDGECCGNDESKSNYV